MNIICKIIGHWWKLKKIEFGDPNSSLIHYIMAKECRICGDVEIITNAMT